MWYFKRFLNSFIIVSLIILAVVIYYNTLTSDRLDEKTAGVICSSLVYNNISENFIITKLEFDDDFKFNKSRIEIYITYSNGKKTSSDCIFYTKYKNNIVKLDKALLVDDKGKLIIMENININYTNDKKD